MKSQAHQLVVKAWDRYFEERELLQKHRMYEIRTAPKDEGEITFFSDDKGRKPEKISNVENIKRIVARYEERERELQGILEKTLLSIMDNTEKPEVKLSVKEPRNGD